MSAPFAKPVGPQKPEDKTSRTPRAFAPDISVAPTEVSVFEEVAPELDAPLAPRRRSWLARIAWTAGGILVSLAIGLAVERLIADLFATQPWLSWLALGVAGVLLLAVVAIALREFAAVWRLRTLDKLRAAGEAALLSEKPAAGKAVAREVLDLYQRRPDLARAREELEADLGQMFDGPDQVRQAERRLLTPLDLRARALTAASAHRVALVTTVSPRALIDLAFVIFESVRLGGAIARLYGARPGLLGTWRLLGAIVTHLAVTGGLVLTDGVVEQLMGQGLAAKLSARLGEGVVNGLMTVRVGIAAMRVVRPLPFAALGAPRVKDFIPELANVLETSKD
jgi:putative membrane protein